MPLQNRVTPSGEIIATEARGSMMGNRGGCFHDAERRLGRTRWKTKQWICCVLSFKGRRRTVMSPGLYTELFFLDEGTALSAGHRPCFECRRADAIAFADAWGRAKGLDRRPSAPAIDEVVHAERVDAAKRKRMHRMRLGDLPEAAFVERDGACWRVAERAGGNVRLLRWSPEGYGRDPLVLAAGSQVDVLTPPSILAALRAGYRVIEGRQPLPAIGQP